MIQPHEDQIRNNINLHRTQIARHIVLVMVVQFMFITEQ